MFTHLMDQLKINRSGPGRPRTRPDRVRGDKAYSSRAIRTHLRDRGIVAVIPQPSDQIGHRKRRGSTGAGLRPSTKKTTKAATSSNGTSTSSNSGGPWQPRKTNSHSPIAAEPFSGHQHLADSFRRHALGEDFVGAILDGGAVGVPDEQDDAFVLVGAADPEVPEASGVAEGDLAVAVGQHPEPC
jgi:hypothetical protein